MNLGRMFREIEADTYGWIISININEVEEYNLVMQPNPDGGNYKTVGKLEIDHENKRIILISS